MRLLCPFCRTRLTAGETCLNDGTALITDRNGTFVDGYEIQELIGVGGSSTVWEATRGDDRVALRFDSTDVDLSSVGGLLTRLKHPNIMRVFGHGTDPEGVGYLIMEILGGETLAEQMVDRQPLPLERALDITRQLTEALKAAHAAGLTYVNVRPAYVFLTRQDGRDVVRLRALGFGRAAPLSTQIVDDDADPLRRETLLYAAPEQIVAGACLPETDQYSLAAIVFQMLTGRPPFDPLKDTQLARAHLLETPQALAYVAPNMTFPEGLQTALSRALAKKPGSRFESMAAFSAALAPAFKEVIADVVVLTPEQPPARLEGQRRWAPWIAIAVLLIAAGAWFALLPSDPPPTPSAPPDAAALVLSADAAAPTVDATAIAQAPPPKSLDAAVVDAKPVEPVAAPTVGTLALTSQPNEATVYSREGKTLGKTPWTAELAPGPHVFSVVSAGFRTSRVKVVIEAGSLIERKIELRPGGGKPPEQPAGKPKKPEPKAKPKKPKIKLLGTD